MQSRLGAGLLGPGSRRRRYIRLGAREERGLIRAEPKDELEVSALKAACPPDEVMWRVGSHSPCGSAAGWASHVGAAAAGAANAIVPGITLGTADAVLSLLPRVEIEELAE